MATKKRHPSASTLRLSEAQRRMLDELAVHYERTRSEIVRWLIRRAHKRITKSFVDTSPRAVKA